MYRFTTSLGQRLYERIRNKPIVDFHNHLSVKELSEDKRFADLTELWIASDPYKHRAMRIHGVAERLITGDAAPYEKFEAWCAVFPQLTGNPLTVWSQTELKVFFGMKEQICPANAKTIWNKANELLAQPGYTARALMAKFPVAYSAPCAALQDDIGPYALIPNAAPSLRADTIMNDPASAARFLEETYGKLHSFAAFADAMEKRLLDFHKAGCRTFDCSLDAGWCHMAEDGHAEQRYAALMAGTLDEAGKKAIACDILRLVAGLCRKMGWFLQLHLGAQRFTSSRLRRVAGPAGGFAGIGVTPVDGVISLLDELEQLEALPRTVLFSMEMSSWDRLAVLTGSFNREGYRGYVQLGPAWWWCDHTGGMIAALESILHFGSLSTFIGMTTDSRSILSFSRHDHFRRVLCNWLGEKVQSGELEEQEEALGLLAEKIACDNALEYLDL